MNAAERPSASKSGPRFCIIVAGMHRSGTSALTRVVNLLGADIARDLMPAVAGDNDRGFWEPLAVVKIHDRLLHQLSSSSVDPFPLPDRWIETVAAREAKRDLAGELEKDFARSQLFVVKDPRIARLLPLWLELLDELAIEPVVVIPLRNPLEVAASLARRNQLKLSPRDFMLPDDHDLADPMGRIDDGLPLAKSLLVYIRSYLETELASRGRRRIFVRYEQLLDDWRQFAARLADMAGSHLRIPSEDHAAAINKFLTVELHHHKCSREELATAPEVAAAVVEIFDRITEAAVTGDETSLRRSFDRLRKTVTEATKLFRGLVMAERDRAREQLSRLTQDHSVSEARVAAENVRLQAEVARHDGELRSTQVRTADLDATIAAQAAETERLHGELAAALARAADLD